MLNIWIYVNEMFYYVKKCSIAWQVIWFITKYMTFDESALQY